MNTQVHGFCAPNLIHLEDVFHEGFSAGREVGASLAVYKAGELVVDLHAGFTDRRKTQAWQPDTLVCCFSISKALTATTILHAVDHGHLTLDEPVSTWWPEFASHNKQNITLRHILSHQSGLAAVRTKLPADALYDWNEMCSQLARTEPWWEPGTAHGYHARTLGFLLGETLRRATGIAFNEYFDEHIRAPLNLDLHFGLSSAEQARCADMIPARINPQQRDHLPAEMREMLAAMADLDSVTGAAFGNPRPGAGYMNKPAFREAIIPALGAHGTAQSIALCMTQVPKLISTELLAQATTPHSAGPDKVLRSFSCFGLGYMLHDERAPIGWDGCFGHAGAGGSIAFYDPERDLAFAFVMNQMQEGVVTGGTTATQCARALFEHLE